METRLIKEVRDLRRRIRINCRECTGGQSFDCKQTDCIFYKVKGRNKKKLNKNDNQDNILQDVQEVMDQERKDEEALGYYGSH